MRSRLKLRTACQKIRTWQFFFVKIRTITTDFLQCAQIIDSKSPQSDIDVFSHAISEHQSCCLSQAMLVICVIDAQPQSIVCAKRAKTRRKPLYCCWVFSRARTTEAKKEKRWHHHSSSPRFRGTILSVPPLALLNYPFNSCAHVITLKIKREITSRAAAAGGTHCFWLDEQKFTIYSQSWDQKFINKEAGRQFGSLYKKGPCQKFLPPDINYSRTHSIKNNSLLSPHTLGGGGREFRLQRGATESHTPRYKSSIHSHRVALLLIFLMSDACLWGSAPPRGALGYN